MTQRPVRASLSIKIVSAGVLAANAALYIIAILSCRPLLVGAILLSVIVVACYFFWVPVLYELTESQLVVHFRLCRVRYGPALRCQAVDNSVRMTRSVGLFRNGGLFAVSGIFWNRQLGVFRAYATSTRPADLMLVETADRRIVISPQGPETFLR